MSEEFTVLYDGPALATHRMSVRDLAPALLGFADAVERAQQIIAPDYPVRLEVQATEAASFDVNLILRDLPELYRQAVAIFSGPEVTAALAVRDIVGGVIGAVTIAVYRLRHGGKPTASPVPASSDTDVPLVRLMFPDETVLETTNTSWVVYQDGQVMVGLRDAVKPLADEGVETFAIAHRGATTVVESSDRAAFDLDGPDETVLLDRTEPMMLQPMDITFRRGGKWKVNNGISRFFVRVEDHAFVDRVEKGVERFGKADIIHAQVRTVQTRTAEGLKTEYTVVRVVEHIAGGEQLSFDLDSE